MHQLSYPLVQASYEHPLKHLVLFHHKAYTSQPKGHEMARITSDLKKQESHQFFTLEEILQHFSHGYSGILAQVKQNMGFVASDLIAVDVDDDDQQTDPKQLFIQTKASGLFYTFSHGIKGNRYRLIFRLDKPITSEELYVAAAELLADDLIKQGFPVDPQVQKPKIPIRGGKSRSEYFIDERNFLSSDFLLERAKRRSEERQRALYERLKKQGENEYRIYPFDELKEMAETIGHIPTGAGRNEEWTSLCLSIKSYEEQGFITYEQGFELFSIISGGEETEARYRGFKPRNITIGTFVGRAKECGYTNKYYFTEGKAPIPKIEYELVKEKFKQFIPTEFALKLLNERKRILIDSPTGSGKTTAFIEAFKQAETSNNHAYIFAVPYVGLVEQLTKEHKVQAVYGANNNKLYKNVFRYVQKEGKRVFVCTYDMTPALLEFLRLTISTDLSFTLVIDEYHKFTTDYDPNYRKAAIQHLDEISKQARTLIALSGTTDEINKNDFDVVIDIDNGQKGSPITDFTVYTYEQKKSGIAELTELIKTTSNHRKLLVFIESKEQIQLIAKALRKQGIKTATLTADDKRNSTYKSIVESGAVDSTIQVILSTSVIADGVSILNDTARFEVIAVCTDFSNLFNPSRLKQMSNRLRKHYDRFSVFMQEQKGDDPKKIYSLDARYYDKEKIAQRLSADLNDDPFFSPLLFHKSILENRYALLLDDENKVHYNRKDLRYFASKDQERYYMGKRLAFIEAVKKVLHVQEARVLNVSEEIRKKRLDMSVVEGLLQEQQEQKKLDDEQKKNALGTAFTKEVYKAFRTDEQEPLQSFKESVLPRHYNHLKQTTKYIGFKTCLHLARQVQCNADVFIFLNDIKVLNDIIYFNSLKRKNHNRKVVEEILKLNEFMTIEEYKTELSQIAKKLKLKIKDVTAFTHYFIYEESRNNKERFKRVVGTITIQHVADKYQLDSDTVKQIMINVAKADPIKALGSIIKSKVNL